MHTTTPTPAQDTTTTAPEPAARDIGPAGTLARVGSGASLLWLAVEIGDPAMWHWAVGLVGLPLATVVVMRLLRRSGAPPARWTGPVGYLVNVLIAIVLYSTVGQAALVFYGAAMFLSAGRGYAGCEVLAYSNALLGRQDEIGCPPFSPIDAVERRVTLRP